MRINGRQKQRVKDRQAERVIKRRIQESIQRLGEIVVRHKEPESLAVH